MLQELQYRKRVSTGEETRNLVPISSVLLPEDEGFIPLRWRGGGIMAKSAEGRVGSGALFGEPELEMSMLCSGAGVPQA